MKGYRIGFTFASIHTGSSLRLFSSLAEHIRNSNDQLFAFPIGRLSFKEENEEMRAGIVPLVNPKNIDGLISWASSLGGAVSVEEVENFHKENFSFLPYVTIGLKCQNHADISFDAYDGYKSAVLHLIKIHGLRRIAMIRGPETHKSAEERFRAYKDGLSESGIEIDENLISSPVSWSNGEIAIRELVEERGLVPGVDFEALCSASDLLMMNAGRYLERKGVKIPKNLKLIGFNNSAESQLLRVPCTTVSMPYERMGVMAYTLIKGILNSPDENYDGPDVVLPAQLIVRRSCGCYDSIGGEKIASMLIKDRKSYIEWANRSFNFTSDESALFEKCMKYSYAFPLLDDEMEDFLLVSSDLIEKLLNRFVDINLIYEAFRWMLLINGNEDYKYFLYNRLLPLVGTSLGRVNLLRDFKEKEKEGILNSLKCELLSLKSFPQLAKSLAKYLPFLSVSAAFVVLKTETDNSRFIGGFDGSVLYTEELDFEEDLILPPHVSSSLGSGVYIVSELFSENTDLGYLVMRSETDDGLLLEELRTSLSSAVQGTYLFESSNKARLRAENAEKARNEFFSNVSSVLRDPLIKIKELTDAMQCDMEIRSAVSHEIEKANHMLDLSLAQTGELDVEESLVNIDSVAEALAAEKGLECEIRGRIPLIYFDVSRLREVLELLVNLSTDNGCSVSVSLGVEEKDSVFLDIVNTEGRLDYRLFLNDTSYLLAEKIMVMHHGEIIPGMGRIRLLFSLPTFSLEAVRQKDGKLLSLAGAEDDSSRFYEHVVSRDEMKSNGRSFYSDIAAVSWDMTDRSYGTLNILRKLSADSSCLRIPLYFYGRVEKSFSPVLLIGNAMKDFDTPPVLILGSIPEALKKVLPEKNIVFIKSLDEYQKREMEQDAGLLITNRELSASEIMDFRKNNNVNFNIMIFPGTFSSSYAESISSIPKVLLANACITESDDFISRFDAILAGAEILPAFTGALVKKALGYFEEHATSQITRWQLAESVNVSEDYLTRIFRKELGISPWDYLNRYRIYLASELLRQEAMSVNEVASRTGFQDQAYFCRVFKKIKGVTPGKMRNRS